MELILCQFYDVVVTRYEYAKFLTLLWGRGLFYLFQGSLALVQFSLLYAVVGVYMFVMGILCIAMWKG